MSSAQCQGREPCTGCGLTDGHRFPASTYTSRFLSTFFIIHFFLPFILPTHFRSFSDKFVSRAPGADQMRNDDISVHWRCFLALNSRPVSCTSQSSSESSSQPASQPAVTSLANSCGQQRCWCLWTLAVSSAHDCFLHQLSWVTCLL